MTINWAGVFVGMLIRNLISTRIETIALSLVIALLRLKKGKRWLLYTCWKKTNNERACRHLLLYCFVLYLSATLPSTISIVARMWMYKCMLLRRIVAETICCCQHYLNQLTSNKYTYVRINWDDCICFWTWNDFQQDKTRERQIVY